MHSKRIVIRVDGGKRIGMGHVVRCLALADMLNENAEILFVLQQTDSSVYRQIETQGFQWVSLPETTDYEKDFEHFSLILSSEDIVVLDGYSFKTAYQRSVKKIGCTLICIDDLHAWHQVADVVINHSALAQRTDYSAEEYTHFLLGLDYVLLRKEFLQAPQHKRREREKVEHVFVSMGAADIHNVSEKVVHALLGVSNVKQVHVLTGAVNPHLPILNALQQKHPSFLCIYQQLEANELLELLSSCDLCICPASGIVMEAISVGIPIVSGYTAENQIANLIGLTKKDVLINLGDLVSVSKEQLRQQLEDLTNSPEKINNLLSAQQHVIDRKSGERIRGELRQLNASKLRFRFANENDVDLYFNWANDPLVRAKSYEQKKIDYESHVSWFNRKLNSTDCHFYLFEEDSNQVVGQVRIDKIDNEVVVGISIDSNHRGKGYGAKMLAQASSHYLLKHPTSNINAYIKEDNIASYSIFKKAGYKEIGHVVITGSKSYHLIKNNK